MKVVIIFFLFLAISYYIFLQRKKIVEGHEGNEHRESDAAATNTQINEATAELKSKEADLEKLLEEVNVLIEREKVISDAIKELDKEDEPDITGDSKICEMTDCKTKTVTTKCTEFKKASGVKCID